MQIYGPRVNIYKSPRIGNIFLEVAYLLLKLKFNKNK
jgi:hypothetical protein